VSTAHAAPGGPGQPRKPADPVRDRPSEPGHGTPPTSSSGGGSHSPYRPGTGQTPPPSSGGYQGTYRPSPAAAVVRRQQILRRAGFGVPVDGVWGARSQAAWDAWKRGIDAATARGIEHHSGALPPLPKGFAYRDGVPVPLHRAAVADAMARARRGWRAYDAGRVDAVRSVQAHARAVLRRASADAAIVDVAHHDPRLRTGEGVSVADRALIEKAARSKHPSLVIERARQAALRAQGRDQAQEAERDQLSAIFGSFDSHRWAEPDAVEQAAKAGRVSAHGLALLFRDGFVDPGDPSDVRAIQVVANQHLDAGRHVKVDGHYGAATNDALTHLFAKAAASDYAHQLGLVKATLYGDAGVGRIAAYEALGHDLKPWQMLQLLQRGGPKADRLARAIAREQEDVHSMRDLSKRRDDWARSVLAARGVYVKGDLTPQQRRAAYSVSGKLGNIWAASRDTHELTRRLNAYRQELERAAAAPQGDPGFWADVTDPIVGGFDEIGGALDATGIPGLVSPAYSWSKTMLQRGVLTAGAVLHPSITANSAGLGASRSLAENWQQSRYTLDDLHAQGGWRGFVFDVVVDPINLVPLGAVAHGGGLALRGLAGESVRSIDYLDRIAGPQMSASVRRAMLGLRDDASIVHADGLKAFAGASAWSGYAGQLVGERRWLRASKIAGELRVLKSERLQAVNKAVDAALTSHLRTVTRSKLLREAGVGHAYTGELALRIAQNRSAAGPELTRAVGETHDAYQAALAQAAPALVERLRAVPSSLYADLSQESGLSFAGRRVEAFLLERASRASLLRLGMLRDLADVELDGVTANTLADQPLEALRRLHAEKLGADRQAAILEEAGSWYRGSVPHDLADAHQLEVEAFSVRLRRQVLPALEGLLHERHGLGVWRVAEDGAALIDEAGQAVRDALDDLVGYSVDEAFSETRAIPNPNYLVGLSEAAKNAAIESEEARRVGSLASWAAMRERLDPAASLDDWLKGEISKIRDELRSAFKLGEDGLWRDQRADLEVPLASVRSVDPSAGDPAYLEATRLVEAVADARHIPKVKVDAAGVMASEDLLGAVVTGEAPSELWKAFVTSAERLEALHSLAADRLAPSAYRREWLFFQAARESSHLPIRALWFATVGPTEAWRFSVLYARPATWIKNAVSNLVQALLVGLRDPRLLWGAAAGTMKSFAEVLPIPLILHAAAMLDRMYGTMVAERLRALIDAWWAQSPSNLERFFNLHGIPVPENFFQTANTFGGSYSRSASRARILANGQVVGDARRAIVRGDLDPESLHARFKGWAFGAIFQNAMIGPETAARRAIYADVFLRRVKELGGDEWGAMRDALDASESASFEAVKGDAMAAARAAVDRALFDYGTVTTFDELAKVIVPFGFYARRNAEFWAREAFEHPFFLIRADHVLSEMQDAQVGEPSWARRYLSLSPLAAVTDEVPGMGWLSGFLRDSKLDPMSYTSASQLYAFWKSGDPLLPSDRAGVKYVADLVDAVSNLGLGVNPILRYLGGRTGVLNRRAWQSAFPQTSFLEALTSPDWIRKQLKAFGVPGVSEQGFNVESALADPLFRLIAGDESDTSFRDASFDSYVNREIAGQVERGERPDRAKAEHKVRAYLALAAVSGFVVGAYPRRITPDDLRLYTLGEEMGEGKLDFVHDLSPREQEAYRLFRQSVGGRRLSAGAFDRYRRGLEAAAPFYAMTGAGSWDDRQAYLAKHPEILPVVEPDALKRIPFEIELRTQALVDRTDLVVSLTGHFLHGIDAAPDVAQAARDALVTPGLEAFWRSTRTPAERRERHIAGAWAHHLHLVNQGYFALSEADIEARQGYLARHPELQEWWAADDRASDDYRGVLMAMNGSFRETYFKLVEAGDWPSADRWLEAHPFIFSFTSAEGRVDSEGRWGPKTEAQKEYAKVAEKLRTWSMLHGHLAEDYLDANPLVRSFLRRWAAPGGVYHHALDYQAVHAQLAHYWSLPAAQRDRYVQQSPTLKAYLAAYAQDRGTSAHARAYLAVRAEMDAFFALPEIERGSYLQRHPNLRDYFNRYADHSGGGVGYHSALRSALASDPSVASRVEFWHRYLALPPDERQRFLIRHGEQYGVFVYGSLSYTERMRREERFEAAAIGRGYSEHAAEYAFVAPLLDVYFSLPESALRALFLQVNPEVAAYFQRWAQPDELIADPKLARLVEQYQRLQPYSQERRDFVEAHPDLQRYFSEHDSPAERAIRRMTDAYFSLPFEAREGYLATHPELKAYFDQRTAEHDLYSSEAAAWNEADPRFKVFAAEYSDVLPLDAVKRFQLAARSGPAQPIYEGTARVERDPEPSTLAARSGRTPS
jgi:hypothetical protein